MANRKINKMQIIPYVFIGPAVIYLIIVTLIPAIMALPISFTNWTALSPKMNFVGLANYKRLLQDSDFYHSIWVMAKFFLSVPMILAVGLIMAMLLNNKLRGMTFFRVVYYSPYITSTIAIAVLFEWFFQPSFGLFNTILSTIGLPEIGWVDDPKTAVFSVIIFRVWKNAGEAMLIYLAGLQDVPKSLMEAANIDGASGWQRFRYITLPLLRPATIYLTIKSAIKVFMIFQETYMLQGPLKSTHTVVNYIYEQGFENAQMGYASAASFVMFVIILIVTFIQFRVMRADVE